MDEIEAKVFLRDEAIAQRKWAIDQIVRLHQGCDLKLERVLGEAEQLITYIWR